MIAAPTWWVPRWASVSLAASNCVGGWTRPAGARCERRSPPSMLPPYAASRYSLRDPCAPRDESARRLDNRHDCLLSREIGCLVEVSSSTATANSSSQDFRYVVDVRSRAAVSCLKGAWSLRFTKQISLRRLLELETISATAAPAHRIAASTGSRRASHALPNGAVDTLSPPGVASPRLMAGQTSRCRTGTWRTFAEATA